MYWISSGGLQIMQFPEYNSCFVWCFWLHVELTIAGIWTFLCVVYFCAIKWDGNILFRRLFHRAPKVFGTWIKAKFLKIWPPFIIRLCLMTTDLCKSFVKHLDSRIVRTCIFDVISFFGKCCSFIWKVGTNLCYWMMCILKSPIIRHFSKINQFINIK